jgi:hypothetical protein
MSCRGIHRLVGKYQEPNTSLAKKHEQDLRYTALTLRNEIIDELRNKASLTSSLIDKVLQISKVIEETTLTREKIGFLEDYYKRAIKKFYYEEGQDYKNNYRLPNKVDNFKAFVRKDDKIKDAALVLIMEMYEQDQINRKELAEEIDNQKKEKMIDVDKVN